MFSNISGDMYYQNKKKQDDLDLKLKEAKDYMKSKTAKKGALKPWFNLTIR